MQLDSLSVVGYIQKWQRASHHHSHDVSGQEGRAQDPGCEEAHLQRAGRGQVLQSMRDPVRGWQLGRAFFAVWGAGEGRASGHLVPWMAGYKGSRVARAERVLTWQQRSCASAFQPCWLRG